MRTPVRNQDFSQTMNIKKAEWLSFVEIMKTFLGNKKHQIMKNSSRCSQHFMTWGAKLELKCTSCSVIRTNFLNIVELPVMNS